MDKVQALVQFWNSFGIPAYDENSVPDRNAMPYITFNVITDSLGNIVNLYGNIWYNSTSWKEVTQKAEEIAKKIGYGYKLKKLDNGYLYITKSNPFSQRMQDTDDTVKRIYINIQAEYLTAY
jgi:uncharacterized protein YebE (UPF0316 family)